MCADRRKRYDDESRREALKLIQTGAGGGSLARRPAMPVQTARQWVLLYGPYCCLSSNKSACRHQLI